MIIGWITNLKKGGVAMNKMQMMDIYDKLAALEVAAAGVPIEHEIWMLKEKLKAKAIK